MNKLAIVGFALAVAAGACDKGKAKGKEAPAPTAPTAATPPPTAATPPPTTPPPAPGATTPDSGFRLPMVNRAVGQVWTKTDDMNSTMELDAGTRKITVLGERHFRDRHEIVAMDGAIVTSQKVTYERREEQETADGKVRVKPHPVAGKSYVVTFADGKLTATLADGGAVPADELAELTADLDDLGRPPVMDQIMAGRSWKVGERYDLTTAELDELRKVKGADKPTPGGYSFTLRSVADGKAVFDMTSQLDIAGKAQMHVELNGAVTFDVASGRPVSLALSGPMKGTAGKMAVSGTMTGNVSYQHEKP